MIDAQSEPGAYAEALQYAVNIKVLPETMPAPSFADQLDAALAKRKAIRLGYRLAQS